MEERMWRWKPRGSEAPALVHWCVGETLAWQVRPVGVVRSALQCPQRVTRDSFVTTSVYSEHYFDLRRLIFVREFTTLHVLLKIPSDTWRWPGFASARPHSATTSSDIELCLARSNAGLIGDLSCSSASSEYAAMLMWDDRHRHCIRLEQLARGRTARSFSVLCNRRSYVPATSAIIP
jgi:hypothetical protein